MKFFAPDLFRNFLFGFIGAGLVLSAGLVDGIDGFGSEILPELQAAEPVRPVSDDIAFKDAFAMTDDIKETAP